MDGNEIMTVPCFLGRDPGSLGQAIRMWNVCLLSVEDPWATSFGYLILTSSAAVRRSRGGGCLVVFIFMEDVKYSTIYPYKAGML